MDGKSRLVCGMPKFGSLATAGARLGRQFNGAARKSTAPSRETKVMQADTKESLTIAASVCSCDQSEWPQLLYPTLSADAQAAEHLDIPNRIGTATLDSTDD